MGVVRSVCISEKKGTGKTPVDSIVLRPDWGIEGDAHAGTWHRQVSLLAFESIDEFKSRGATVDDGDFGENIIVEGIGLTKLPVGTRLECGNNLLEVTQIGKECHTRCAIYHSVGDCIMPREGVFARVIRGGELRPGDPVTIVSTPEA